MKPGSDMACGCASSLTVKLPPSSCASTLRRVESDSAANTRSRRDASLLTIGFSFRDGDALVKPRMQGAMQRGPPLLARGSGRTPLLRAG